MDNVDKVFKKLHLKLRSEGYQSCLADKFADKPKDNSVIGMLTEKMEEETSLNIYELPEWASARRAERAASRTLTPLPGIGAAVVSRDRRAGPVRG